MKKILICAAHPDDAEIGFGGTIIKFVDSKCRVFLIDLTDGEPTPRGSVNIRSKEARSSARIMGIEKRITLDLPNRYLQDTIPARNKVAVSIREIRPDIIFAPYWIDAHPDHIAASRIVDAARFYAKFTKTDLPFKPFFAPKIFYFVTSHLKLALKPDFIIDISEQFERKIRAVKCYRSQLKKASFKKIENNNSYFGQLIGKNFGEPVISREPLGISDLKLIQ